MKKVLMFIVFASVFAIDSSAQAGFVKKLSRGYSQTLVVYGTSVESLGSGRLWVEEVGNALNKDYKGELTLFNSGRSGQNSNWALQNVQDSVIARHPDAVLLEFATNDAVERFDISLKQCKENTVELIARIKAALPDCEIILQTTCGYPLGKNLESRPRMKEYNDVYAEIAKEQKLLLIDESDIFRELGETLPEKVFRQYSGDGVHSTKKGASEIYFPVVMQALTGNEAKYKLEVL